MALGYFRFPVPRPRVVLRRGGIPSGKGKGTRPAPGVRGPKAPRARRWGKWHSEVFPRPAKLTVSAHAQLRSHGGVIAVLA
jgi:hypothetical protein